MFRRKSTLKSNSTGTIHWEAFIYTVGLFLVILAATNYFNLVTNHYKINKLLTTYKLALVKPPIIPDHKFTPGVAFKLSSNILCAKDYRPFYLNRLDNNAAKKIYMHYNITKIKNYTLYYLIPPTLGGVPDIKNIALFSVTPPGLQEKEWLDEDLYKKVCINKTMPLSAAQTCLANNWWECYQKELH